MSDQEEALVVQIELPSYAYSFNLRLPSSTTVLQVKSLVSQTCPGSPRVDGQRIVFRGRFLQDSEKLEDLCSPDDQLVFHLAVNPSAWTSDPPNPPLPVPSPAPRLPQTPPPPPSAPSSSGNNPLGYVFYVHQNALLVLVHGYIIQPRSEPTAAKQIALQYLERSGWQWPSILDEPYPPPSEGGLKYDRSTIDGQMYLQLRNPGEAPTPIQVHALKILSYTFSILRQPAITHIPSRVIPSNSIPIPPHVNQVLQQLGLPQLPNHNPQPPLNVIQNQIILRPLILPFILHGVRLLLVLYFFAPARKPLFGLLIAWLLFELWQRGIFNNNNNRPAAEQAGRENPAPRQDEAQPVPQANRPAQAANANNNNNAADGRQAAPPHQLVDALANYNLNEEEEILNGTNNQPPTLGKRIFAFFSLLTTTIHPAVWDRRRAVLSRREGRLRTEDVALRENQEGSESQDDARAQRRAELAASHARRNEWTQRYVQRAVNGDWVDEAD